MVNLTLPTPGTSSGAWGTIINQAFTDLNNGKADIANVVPSVAAPFTAYAPSWTNSITNPVIGNGASSGYYLQVGKLVYCYGRIIAGSTTTFGSGTGYSVGLPVPAAATLSNIPAAGIAWLRSSADYDGICLLVGSSFVVRMNTYGGSGLWTSTNPFAFANGNWMSWNFTYEAA